MRNSKAKPRGETCESEKGRAAEYRTELGVEGWRGGGGQGEDERNERQPVSKDRDIIEIIAPCVMSGGERESRVLTPLERRRRFYFVTIMPREGNPAV